MKICHAPSPMYGGPNDSTPSPVCSTCQEVYMNLRSGLSSCPNGHGGLRSPVVDMANWTAIKPALVTRAKLAGQLVCGSVLNRPVVDKTDKTHKHPKNAKLGKKVK